MADFKVTQIKLSLGELVRHKPSGRIGRQQRLDSESLFAKMNDTGKELGDKLENWEVCFN